MGQPVLGAGMSSELVEESVPGTSHGTLLMEMREKDTEEFKTGFFSKELIMVS